MSRPMSREVPQADPPPRLRVFSQISEKYAIPIERMAKIYKKSKKG